MTLKQIQLKFEQKLRTLCQDRDIEILANNDPKEKNRKFRFVDRKSGMYCETELNEDYLNSIENPAQRMTEFYYSLLGGVQQLGNETLMNGDFTKMQEEQNGAPIDVECEVE